MGAEPRGAHGPVQRPGRAPPSLVWVWGWDCASRTRLCIDISAPRNLQGACKAERVHGEVKTSRYRRTVTGILQGTRPERWPCRPVGSRGAPHGGLGASCGCRALPELHPSPWVSAAAWVCWCGSDAEGHGTRSHGRVSRAGRDEGPLCAVGTSEACSACALGHAPHP